MANPWKITDSSGKDYNYFQLPAGSPAHFEYTPQALLDAREQYKNDPEALARLNAGMYSFDYSPTVWDRLGSQFGFDTGYSRLQREYQVNADAYLQETLNNLQTRDYNSESDKAARMRAAGLNPDLQGLQGASEENNMAPDETPPNVSAGNTPDFQATAEQVSQTAISLVTGMFQMGSLFQSIKGQKLDNIGKDITNTILKNDAVTKEIGANSSASDFALKFLSGRIPADIKGDFSDEQFENLIAAASKEDFADYSDDTARILRRMFSTYSGELQNGKPSLALEKLKTDLQRSISENKNQIAHNVAQPYYSDDDAKMIKDIGDACGDYYMKILKLQFDSSMQRLRADRAGADADYSQAHYQRKYWDSLDPYSASGAQNATNRLAVLTNKFNQETEKLWLSIATKLEHSKSKFAPFGLIMLPAMRAWTQHPTLPSMPSFSLSRGAVNTNTISPSLSFGFRR